MNVLVLNAGSSSLRFELIRTDPELMGRDEDERLAGGMIERIGGQALVQFEARGRPPTREATPIRDYRTAISRVLTWLACEESGVTIDGM